jgi:hypothetical protein
MHPEGQHPLVTHWSAVGKKKLRYNVSYGALRMIRLARLSVPIGASAGRGAVNRIAVNQK